MRDKRQLVTVLFGALQLLFVGLVGTEETVGLVSHGLTLLPRSFIEPASKIESILAAILRRPSPAHEPARQAINTYLHLAGIESGYGFFAPSVPPAYRLVFEFSYPDGRNEYESARFAGGESNLRLTSLLDYVARLQFVAGREYLVRSLATSAWQSHPEALRVRAIIGSLVFPPPRKFLVDPSVTFEVLTSYTFDRGRPDDNKVQP